MKTGLRLPFAFSLLVHLFTLLMLTHYLGGGVAGGIYGGTVTLYLPESTQTSIGRRGGSGDGGKSGAVLTQAAPRQVKTVHKPDTALRLKDRRAGKSLARIPVARAGQEEAADLRDAPIAPGPITEGGALAGTGTGYPDLSEKGVLPWGSVPGLVTPSYPRRSRERGEEGTVVLVVEILSKGLPGEVKVVSSSGYGRLDRAAKRAVRSSFFTAPSLYPTIRVAFRFRLEDRR